MKTRPNFAEGYFYSADKKELAELLELRLEQENPSIDYSLAKKHIIGGVVPHAGHIYCAREAVHFFQLVKNSGISIDTVILVNPNHNGQGLPISIDAYDYWESPFGKIEIDRELAFITQIPTDTLSQRDEHSGEVIVSYIQYFLGNKVKVLPISFGNQNGKNAMILGNKIYEAVKSLKRNILFVASSDFNHFDKPEVGRELDDYALEALLQRNPQEFDYRVNEKDISICGFGTILALMQYSSQICKDYHIKVLSRGNSGELNPSDSVVDYVSLLFFYSLNMLIIRIFTYCDVLQMYLSEI